VHEDRRHQLAWVGAALTFALALCAAAIVPGHAWSPGSRELTHASRLLEPRMLQSETGLTITPSAGAVIVSTGDGGGAGRIDGVREPVRVRAGAFRGIACWEIGSEPGEPAAYVDDNGVRLDDSMTDRLAVRAWPLPALLALVALVLRASRRRHRFARWAPLPLAVATLLLAARIV